MKTYLIVALENGKNRTIGTPIITCSMETAIEMKNHLNNSKDKSLAFEWVIWEYDVITQGKNKKYLTFAKHFKEPF